jgi:hypothetical protein
MTSKGKRGQYGSLWTTLRKFFRGYGGLRALSQSPYLHGAIVFCLLSFPLWLTGGAVELAVAVVPALLGFSVAAFTLSLGIGSEKFRIIFASSIKGGRSAQAELSDSFLHFILMQVFALLIAFFGYGHPIRSLIHLFATSWDLLPIWLQVVLCCLKSVYLFVVLLSFFYALLLVIPAILHIYRASEVFGKFAQKEFEVMKARQSRE